MKRPEINYSLQNSIQRVVNTGLMNGEEKQLTENEVELYNRLLLAMSLQAEELVKLQKLGQERWVNRGR